MGFLSIPLAVVSCFACLSFSPPVMSQQDPGNLESALQVGCQTGYSLLWLLAASVTMVSKPALVEIDQKHAQNSEKHCLLREISGKKLGKPLHMA